MAPTTIVTRVRSGSAPPASRASARDLAMQPATLDAARAHARQLHAQLSAAPPRRSDRPRTRGPVPQLQLPRGLLDLPLELLYSVLSMLDLREVLDLSLVNHQLQATAEPGRPRATPWKLGTPDVGPPDDASARGLRRLEDRPTLRAYLRRVSRGLANLHRVSEEMPLDIGRRPDLAPGECEVVEGRALVLTLLAENLMPHVLFADPALMLFNSTADVELRTVVDGMPEFLLSIKQPEQRIRPLAAMITLAMHVDASIERRLWTPSDLVQTIRQTWVGPDAPAWLGAYIDCRATWHEPLSESVGRWMRLGEDVDDGGDVGDARQARPIPAWKLRLLDMPHAYLAGDTLRVYDVFVQLHRVAMAAEADVFTTFMQADPQRAPRLLTLGGDQIEWSLDGARTAHQDRFMDIVERLPPDPDTVERTLTCCAVDFDAPAAPQPDPARRAVAWVARHLVELDAASAKAAYKSFLASAPESTKRIDAAVAAHALDLALTLAEHMPANALDALLEPLRDPPSGRPASRSCRTILGQLLSRVPEDAFEPLANRLRELDDVLDDMLGIA